MEAKKIIFFDGVCNLCNKTVNYIIARDSGKIFHYTSLQGETAKNILGVEKSNELDTIYYRDNGVLYKKSTAMLRILKQLGGFTQLFYVFIIVPRPVRDMVYDFIAKNRYRWMGKQSTCRVPTKEMQESFLA